MIIIMQDVNNCLGELGGDEVQALEVWEEAKQEGCHAYYC
jgi:hypothetical protein